MNIQFMNESFNTFEIGFNSRFNGINSTKSCYIIILKIIITLPLLLFI